MSLSLLPASVAARPPTAGQPHIGAGYGFGETFAGGLNPYRHALTFQAGMTFLNGFYIGAMTDLYFGAELEEPAVQATADAWLFGAVIGVDLKMAATVSGRVTVTGGLQRMALDAGTQPDMGGAAQATDVLEPARARAGNAFIGPGLEMVLLVGDIFYVAPAARLNVLLLDHLPLMTTFSISLGLSL